MKICSENKIYVPVVVVKLKFQLLLFFMVLRMSVKDMIQIRQFIVVDFSFNATSAVAVKCQTITVFSFSFNAFVVGCTHIPC